MIIGFGVCLADGFPSTLLEALHRLRLHKYVDSVEIICSKHQSDVCRMMVSNIGAVSPASKILIMVAVNLRRTVCLRAAGVVYPRRLGDEDAKHADLW